MLTPDGSGLDYRALLRASKTLDCTGCVATQRVAVLSDAAVPQLVPLLKVVLARARVRADVYLAEYDATELEAFDEASGLYRFSPDVVVVLPSTNALRLRYHRQSEDRAHFADRVAESWGAVWDAIRRRSSAVVLQGNVVPPYDRQFGNFDQMVPDTLHVQVSRLNVLAAELARTRDHVLIVDVAALACRVGLDRWYDDRMWAVAKTFCALEHLPLVAQSVADVVLAKLGRGVKCVVVDLDNTLWGGIVGDDGVEGLRLDPFGDGEPHHRLQLWLRELARRGILLAVCSKNEHATALDAFRRHPDMALREDDVALFVANWSPKPENIREIQRRLNVGLDAIVFLDDDAFERRYVREALPDVIVPELPPDPADWVRFLCELNLFEAASLSDEDRRRGALYRAETSRTEARAEYRDVGEYLQSLDMRIAVRRFDAAALPRVVQLLQRSNQFNLTTRRHVAPVCEAMMRDDACVPFYVSLADRFGDSGLVSVVILRRDGDVLGVDSWVMSCRVLGRGVEQFVMNKVFEAARGLGCRRVEGTYVPTAKNGMVREFYGGFGFERTAARDDGATTWSLAVDAYRPRDAHLQEVP